MLSLDKEKCQPEAVLSHGSGFLACNCPGIQSARLLCKSFRVEHYLITSLELNQGRS